MKDNPSRYPITHEGVLSSPDEGLIIGNGDLAASAQVFSHELTLTLGKNDVWDSRLNVVTEEVAFKQDDLIRYTRENGFSYPYPTEIGHPPGGVYDWPGKPAGVKVYDFSLLAPGAFGASTGGPSPKRVGILHVRHPGLSDTGVRSRVDIASGMLTVDYTFHEGTLRIEAFIQHNQNTLLMRLSAQGRIPWINLILEKPPDYADPTMPPPVVRKGAGDRQWALSQTIPGKYGVSDFTWHTAASFVPREKRVSTTTVRERAYAGSSEPRAFAYAVKQDITLDDGQSVVLALGVATDRDGAGDRLKQALSLAGTADEERYESDKGTHESAWREWWSASAIELEDKELESAWYRSMYGFACHLKPGAQAPGLNANIAANDYSPWQGFYTWNHNVQKWYFPALAVNHPEWYDVFADLLEQHTPLFEHLANVIFGLEGVYCDLMSTPFMDPHHALTHARNGRALAHIGWLAMMLFQHYQFTGDTEWLRRRAFPFIKKTAHFYAGYLDKYQQQDNVIYPSIRLEDNGWGVDFLGNENVNTDLVMFRQAFRAAIAAAGILGVDPEQQANWQAHLARVPAIDYGWQGGRGWYALCQDWQKAWPDFNEYVEHVRTSRWGCGAWLVFPGEYIDGDEEEGLAAVIRDIIRPVDLYDLPPMTTILGTFHGEATAMPFIRLGMREQYPVIRKLLLGHRFNSGQFSPYSVGDGEYVRTPSISGWRIVENQYMPILGIAEMLLQSQGDVIRLFPYWPREQAAAFSTLRARGGFLVSARWQPGAGLTASITSLCGNLCRVRWQEARPVSVATDGKTVSCRVEGRDIVFATIPNAIYELRS
ncbi:MAG: glycosyl hydrolase family 95 catalytic domain-containing protein [Anaerolineae bacterium]